MSGNNGYIQGDLHFMGNFILNVHLQTLSIYLQIFYFLTYLPVSYIQGAPKKFIFTFHVNLDTITELKTPREIHL